MIETLLAQPRHAAAAAVRRLRRWSARVLMLVLRHPMRVAMALISTMVFLGGIYGLLGVHFIAAFQVLIYVGAVMVFMVYVIMLLDVRDPSFTRRFSRLLVPGVAGGVLLLARARRTRSGAAVDAPAQHDACRSACSSSRSRSSTSTGCTSSSPRCCWSPRSSRRSPSIKGSRRTTMDKMQLLLLLAMALFALGLLGVIVRRNVLVMLMCMELMLNGVNLSLVTFAQQTGTAVGRRAGVPDLRRRGRRDRASPSRSCCCSCAASARSTSTPTATSKG